MKYFLLLSFMLLFGCIRKPSPGPADPVKDNMERWAKEIVKNLPDTTRVVIMAPESRSSFYPYTMLGKDFQDKFSYYLFRALGNRILVDREIGAKAFEEEMQYIVVKSKNEAQMCSTVLEKFRANYAIFISYELGDRFIEFFPLRAVPTAGGELVASASGGKITLDAETSDKEKKREADPRWPPSHPTEEEPFFIRENGEWSIIRSVNIIDYYSGEEIPQGSEIKVDTYYRIKVELDPTRSPIAVWLYVFGYQKDGGCYYSLLYPIFGESYSAITQSTIIIPENKSYIATAPGGHNWAVAIVTKEKLEVEPSKEFSLSSTDIKNIERKIANIGKSKWGARGVEFWITK